MSTKIEDQPPPAPQGDRPAMWPLVIADYKQNLDDPGSPGEIDAFVVADMEARDKLGRDRYGTPLTAHNGRNQLVDAYQEALDLVVYLRAAIEELPSANMIGVNALKRIRLVSMYKRQFYTVWELRKIITEGEAAKRAQAIP